MNVWKHAEAYFRSGTITYSFLVAFVVYVENFLVFLLLSSGWLYVFWVALLFWFDAQKSIFCYTDIPLSHLISLILNHILCENISSINMIFSRLTFLWSEISNNVRYSYHLHCIRNDYNVYFTNSENSNCVVCGMHFKLIGILLCFNHKLQK